MKQATLQPTAAGIRGVALGLVLFASSPAMAQTRTPALPALIDQNIRATVASSDRIAKNLKTPVPQLWVHVRSQEQKSLVDQRRAWFQSLQAAGVRVDLRPTQLVASGPHQTQLRFFREADLPQAQALLNELRRGIPDVVLSNLSAQYKQATWIDPGHLELWLAPDVNRIATP